MNFKDPQGLCVVYADDWGWKTDWCLGGMGGNGANSGIDTERAPNNAEEYGPGPGPGPRVSDEEMMARLTKGLNRAAQALLSQPDCSTLFGWTGPQGNASPSSVDGIIGVLSNISNSFKFGEIPSSRPNTVTSATTSGLGAKSIDLPGGATMNVSAGVVIWLNNTSAGASFVDGSVNDWATTILHELGHAYWNLYGPNTSMIAPDGDSTATSMANSAAIRQRCRL